MLPCGTAESFAKYGSGGTMVTQIETGILRQCGMEEPRLAMPCGTPEGAAAAVRPGATV